MGASGVWLGVGDTNADANAAIARLLLTIKRRTANKTKFKYQVEAAAAAAESRAKTTVTRRTMTVTTRNKRKKLSSLKILMTFPLFAQGNESQQSHYVCMSVCSRRIHILHNFPLFFKRCKFYSKVFCLFLFPFFTLGHLIFSFLFL